MTELVYIPLDDIDDDYRLNCRGKITPIDVVDLAKDIALRGLIQPIAVSKYDEAKKFETGKQWRLLAGFRRFMAHKINKATKIECVIRQIDNELDALTFNLAENIKRKDLNILQEAKAIERLRRLGVPEQEAAERLDASRGWVQVRFMLLGLPEEIQQEAAAKVITQENIRQLYTIYHKTGDKEQIFAAVRQLKEAKSRGRIIKITANKEQAKRQKKHRKRPEIFELMEHLQETVGNGLHTRVLAWAAGEISEEDLYYSIKVYADDRGLSYRIPV
jgi:ParB family chromosome partitioning protein